MNYFIKEVQTSEGVQKTAGIKARDDVESVLLANGFQSLTVETNLEKRKKANFLLSLYYHYDTSRKWNKVLNKLTKGDCLLIQFPVINHTIFFKNVICKLQKKGVTTVLLVHDLETIRASLRNDVSAKARKRLNL